MRLISLRWMPQITIERLRTLVLIGGGLLVAAIAIFLVGGQWKRHFLTKDLPKRLGIDIQQQADGVNYTQSRKGKTLFKIHAARAVQMKQNGKYLLHDVQIDLYGEDGSRTDTISGGEFEYEPSAGLAHAAGLVEIALMRPGVKPAIAQLKPGGAKSGSPSSSPHTAQSEAKAIPGAPAASNQVTDSEIHVKTSGLFFDQKTGVATTAERVDFALQQGSGNSIGATYDSAKGHLVLDHAVELHVERSSVHGDGGPVTVHAVHADFERSQDLCQLTQALADYSGGTAQAANALIHFRQDGSVMRLDGSGGVDIKTLKGSHVTAPIGTLDFDEHNHPSHGLLEGGARLEMSQPARQVQGTSPIARLLFDGEGQLSQAHMEQGVLFNTEQQVTTAKGISAQVKRSWTSKTADVAFSPLLPGGKGAGKPNQLPDHRMSQNHAQGGVEPRTIHGYGGVVITSETSSAGTVTPSKLSADTVVAELAPGSVLSSLVGTGHAAFEQRTAAGVHQSSNSDQLDVRFVPVTTASDAPAQGNPEAKKQAIAGDAQISSIVQIGHVVLVQDPAPPRPGQSGQTGQAAQSQIRATASRSDYDGESQILHLTGTPRVRDGALDMTANQIDFARNTGDAFAHGDVKASWSEAGSQSPSPAGSGLLGGNGRGGNGLGGNGPVHAIAAEAELHQSTQEVIFRAADPSSKSQAGNLPRLWQAANSVSAPLITLNRQKQTLTAQADGAAKPVRTVLVSNPAPKSSPGTPESGKTDPEKTESQKMGTKSKPDAPSVIRVRSGELHYSEGERLALFHSGSVGSVTMETTATGGVATVVSRDAEVKLLPAGVHANRQNAGSGNESDGAPSRTNASVDQLISLGHVTVDWPDRKGTGEKLVYLSEDGTFTLTGTAAAPPRMTDQARGAVTGSALIYHSRDGSVTVEGDGAKTATDTRTTKK
jgi:lipopolysaccharide export system protein LptA